MEIIIQRGKKVSLESLPQYSIALDGFVQGPQVDSVNKRYSFDHHDGCLRYCTTSACMQSWTAILLGLDPSQYTIYINDVDIDVCAAIWCLKNPERCNEAPVKKLIDAINLGDMHGGAFPLNGMAKVVEWVAKPETDSRKNNDYENLSISGLNAIMEAILHRIDLYVNGEAQIDIQKQVKHSDFKVLRNENDWVLAESKDPHALSSVYQSGFDKVVLIKRTTDKSINVTIAKRSDFIAGFCLPSIFKALNEAEGIAANDGWGGGSTIGGAPRYPDGSRSKLSLDKITEVIDKVVKDESA